MREPAARVLSWGAGGWLHAPATTPASGGRPGCGETRIPLLGTRAENGMSLAAPLSRGAIHKVAEPRRTWEVFFWTLR